MMKKHLLFGFLCLWTASVTAQDAGGLKVTPLIKSPITGVEGHKALVARVVVPAKTEAAAHYHPNEEFLYIAKGTALVRIEGQGDRILKPGEAIVIPAKAIHTAINLTTEDVVALVFRVHPDGQPVRLDPETKETTKQ